MTSQETSVKIINRKINALYDCMFSIGDIISMKLEYVVNRSQ